MAPISPVPTAHIRWSFSATNVRGTSAISSISSSIIASASKSGEQFQLRTWPPKRVRHFAVKIPLHKLIHAELLARDVKEPLDGFPTLALPLPAFVELRVVQ